MKLRRAFQNNETNVPIKPRFIDLFAGIGGIRLGLERAGGRCVFSSEWNEKAQATYEANFSEKPWGDITKISSHEIPDHDILAGGFPCQAFSIIGSMKGFADTRGTLFFQIEKILRAKKPRAFLLENVKQLVTHDNKRTFETILGKLRDLGYYVHWEVLNALNFGIPQKRERVIIVGFAENHPFRFPKYCGNALKLEDVLEKDKSVPRKYYASKRIADSVRARLKRPAPFPSIWHENKGGNISANEFSCALRASASYNYLLVNGKRRLTPRENLRIMGFPDDFKIVVSDADIRRQCGNSVALPVIEAVAKEIVSAMGKPPLLLNGEVPLEEIRNGQLAFA